MCVMRYDDQGVSGCQSVYVYTCNAALCALWLDSAVLYSLPLRTHSRLTQLSHSHIHPLPPPP